MNVRPHPHIGLATVTYLFEGAFMHRDSLGSEQVIRPGDVNWMVAGRGIVHSERTPPEVRDADGRTRAHGIQTWVGLAAVPRRSASRRSSITRRPACRASSGPDATVTVIAGTAYGLRSPVAVFSPTLYVDARLRAGARLEIEPEHEQRGCYVAAGCVELGGERFGAGQFVVLARAAGAVSLRALEDSRVMLAGGAALDGPRYIDWNFVSSSRERIEARQERLARTPLCRRTGRPRTHPAARRVDACAAAGQFGFSRLPQPRNCCPSNSTVAAWSNSIPPSSTQARAAHRRLDRIRALLRDVGHRAVGRGLPGLVEVVAHLAEIGRPAEMAAGTDLEHPAGFVAERAQGHASCTRVFAQ